MGRAEGTLESVQLLRAAAALAVAFWHLGWVARAFPGALPPAPTPLAFGYAGVDLFFVISGFILCHVTWGRPFAPGRFAARRFLRIVPLYTLFTGLALLAVAVNPAWDSKGNLDPGYIARSLLIVPMREGPFLGVGWSLEHELLFYALVGGLCAWGRPRALASALAALFVGGVALHVLLPEWTGRRIWDFHLVSLYHFEFLMGVAVFHLRDRLPAWDWRWLLAAGVAGFLLTSSAVGSAHAARDPLGHVGTFPQGWLGLARVLGYGSASALLLAGLLQAERRGALAVWAASRWRPALRAGLWIGEASYVLYLSHYFVYSILSKLYAALGAAPALALPALALALAAATAFALAVHLAVERPLLATVRRRLRPARGDVGGDESPYPLGLPRSQP